MHGEHQLNGKARIKMLTLPYPLKFPSLSPHPGPPSRQNTSIYVCGPPTSMDPLVFSWVDCFAEA